jgi:hypothetical protein
MSQLISMAYKPLISMALGEAKEPVIAARSRSKKSITAGTNVERGETQRISENRRPCPGK